MGDAPRTVNDAVFLGLRGTLGIFSAVVGALVLLLLSDLKNGLSGLDEKVSVLPAYGARLDAIDGKLTYFTGLAEERGRRLAVVEGTQHEAIKRLDRIESRMDAREERIVK